MTNDGLNTLVYDGENRTVSAVNGGSSGAYVYDGNGLRVKKCVPNCTSPTTTTVYLFSGSKVVAEYVNGAAPSAPTKEYIYSGGQLLATLTSSSTTYHHGDHLSVRVSTDTSGNKIADQGHFPYGETWYFGSSGTKWEFTSYERDAESGNDYALARYNVNRLGRFSSPDPLSGSTADPQSLNRYSYVENDPINAADPSGLKMMPPPAWLGLTFFYGGFPTGGFGSNWNEFDLMQIPVVVGTLYHFTGTLNYSNYGLQDLLRFANQGEINVTTEPIFSGGFVLDSGGGPGGNSSGGGPQTQLSPKAQACENKIQGAVNSALNTNSTYLGPTTGPGMSPEGFRNGAYNFNYFAPGVPNPVAGSINGSGRFPGSGLHVPLPGGQDPTIPNWGPGVYMGQSGSFLTAHFDSANPRDDLFGFFKHLINDVILRRPHGC